MPQRGEFRASSTRFQVDAPAFMFLLLAWSLSAGVKLLRPDVDAFALVWSYYGVDIDWARGMYWAVLAAEVGIVLLISRRGTRRFGAWASFWFATLLLWANIALAADRMDCGCFGGFAVPLWGKYAIILILLSSSAWCLHTRADACRAP